MTDVVDQSPPAARRPWTSSAAAALLALMGLCGLAYAIATLAVTPGVVDRFRGAVAAGSSTDGLVTLLWIGAAIGSVLGVILFALYVALAFGLRRGSNGSRIAVWVLCALGFLSGGISLLTVLVQQSGERVPGSAGDALISAYPSGWIGLNESLAGLQMAGYVAVAVLLIVTPRAAFGRKSRDEAVVGGPAPYGLGPAPTAVPTSGHAPYPSPAGMWGQGPAVGPPHPYGPPPPAMPAPGHPSHGAAALYGPGQPAYGAAPGQLAYGAAPGPPPYGAAPGQPPYGAAPDQPAYGTPADQPPQGAAAASQAPYGPAASVGSAAPPTGYERPASAGPGPTSPGMPPPTVRDPHADAAHDFWQRPEPASAGDHGSDRTPDADTSRAPRPDDSAT